MSLPHRLTLPLLMLPGLAAAATHVWPGAAPCNSTLQACVDAAADGDRIEVAAAKIDEDISLYDKDGTLVAADGVHPAFAPGRWLSISSSALSGDRNVTVGGFSFTDGYVYAGYRGTGTAGYDIGKMTLTRRAGNTTNYILVNAEAGTVNANVHENRLEGLPAGSSSGLIWLKAAGGTLKADARYNRVAATAAGLVGGAGILADYAGAGSGGRVRLHANEVRGSFGLGGIVASEGLGSATPASFDARVYNNVVVGTAATASQGIRALVNTGTINWQVIANTVTRVDWGLYAGPYSGATAGARIDGIVSTNLVRATGVGLYVDATNAPSLTNDYNLINAPAIANTGLGAHTITAPAQLFSDDMPRLRADSPAIDAGDTATLGIGLIVNALPVTDADGLRRIKGATNDVDIGAYEYGDVSFLHTATPGTIDGHITWLDDPAANGLPAANLFVTPNFNIGQPSGGVVNSDPFGTWYSGGRWSVFHEDTAVAMPPGAHFDVFSAAAGSGAFRHVANAGNITGAFSQLDNSSVNNLPDRIVLATQNYTAGPVYNPHPIGVFYFTLGGPGAWLVANLDDATMPSGAGFSVYAQEPSPNAFRAVATAANHPSASTLVLDHPLLNATPCAQPIVTRMYDGTTANAGFDVYYNAGRWLIFAYDGMPIGTQFNVLVSPAQVAACNDVIFADGFD